MDLGKTIKQCRKLREMTQTKLSERSGISISNLCLIESGKLEPSRAAAEAIANALSIPLTLLVFLAAEDWVMGGLDDSQIDRFSRGIRALMSSSGQ